MRPEQGEGEQAEEHWRGGAAARLTSGGVEARAAGGDAARGGLRWRRWLVVVGAREEDIKGGGGLD